MGVFVSIVASFLLEQNLIAIVLQAFAIHLSLDFGGSIERRFDVAEAEDDIFRTFVADAGSTWNVVDRVAL